MSETKKLSAGAQGGVSVRDTLILLTLFFLVCTILSFVLPGLSSNSQWIRGGCVLMLVLDLTLWIGVRVARKVRRHREEERNRREIAYKNELLEYNWGSFSHWISEFEQTLLEYQLGDVNPERLLSMQDLHVVAGLLYERYAAKMNGRKHWLDGFDLSKDLEITAIQLKWGCKAMDPKKYADDSM